MTMSRSRLRVLAITSAVAVGLTLALAVRSPEERVMGGLVRIMFVHVGAAWTGYLAYGLAALGSAVYLASRSRWWDRLALSAAEWGLVLTTVMLVTGSLWGRAANNWWWNWGDARLVVTLLLWFLYAAYLVVRQFVPGEGGRVTSAILALIGIPVMVLNHFAVVLWQRAHPSPVILRPAGPAMDDVFLQTLLVAQVAYVLVFVTVLVMRMQLEALRDGETGAYQP